MARHCAFIKADMVKINQTTGDGLQIHHCVCVYKIYTKVKWIFQWRIEAKKATFSKTPHRSSAFMYFQSKVKWEDTTTNSNNINGSRKKKVAYQVKPIENKCTNIGFGYSTWRGCLVRRASISLAFNKRLKQ